MMCWWRGFSSIIVHFAAVCMNLLLVFLCICLDRDVVGDLVRMETENSVMM